MNDRLFDALVADFYRAATGAIEWEVALTQVQQAFGARAALLHTVDIATGRLINIHSGGPALADAMLTYIRDFHEVDPRRRHVIALGVEGLGRWQYD